MSLVCREAGTNQPLIQRWKHTLASTAVALGLGLGVWLASDSAAWSAGETRTLSLYHVHTGESLTVTYKQDGKYIPSALKKINYLMRDWRRKEVITIDPKTIDLMWELHADLGSKKPIHIICGYRSPRTNAFLKRIGRNVARKSQHMAGKAIDLYFPDVPTVKIRNSALVRQVGGVGYYRSAGGPTGFLHIDSGRVRHWGPGISATQMAQIMREYRRTVGARLNKKDQVMVASAESAGDNATPSLYERLFKSGAKTAKAAETAPDYSADDEDLADLAADASEAPAKPRVKLQTEAPAAAEPPAETAAPAVIADAAVAVPKPRPKPLEVLVLAAVNMNIEPASAPPPDQMARQKPSPASDPIGVVIAAETMKDLSAEQPQSNLAAKGSLAEELRDGITTGVPVIQAMAAPAAGHDFWWPTKIIFSRDEAVRRDGEPQDFAGAEAGLLPGVDQAEAAPAPFPKLAVASATEVAGGKSDMQVVNREGKGSLLEDAPAVKARKLKLGQMFP